MKKKILNRVNIALGAFIFSLLGFSSCEGAKKYGPPEPEMSVLYGPAPDFEEVVDTTANNPVAEE